MIFQEPMILFVSIAVILFHSVSCMFDPGLIKYYQKSTLPKYCVGATGTLICDDKPSRNTNVELWDEGAVL
ncbi:unnamed protein product [Thelazia callipaeda]|uniref:SCY domain-containing protein n=1 Tax=Thelazia callipaeda TaxID=103827 RepID=A0A0N5DBQ1_THECL|nr:unnamed protein product [Thelazia callipaeda]